jgi:ATP-dependent Lhr-like helicase
VGLSATVGNPGEIAEWLAGSSTRRLEVVNPVRPPVEREITIDLMDEAHVVQRVVDIGYGKKSLVFVETRAQAEEVAGALQGGGVGTFVHHGSVSREDRERAEAQFQSGTNVAIVCTSTLELGIDIGDLDHVIQIEAPASVSSMLQRMGRTGRRAGATANCHFLCTEPDVVLQATALTRLAERGFVEKVGPDYACAHVLAHQVMALSLQELGVSRHRVLPWMAGASPYKRLASDDVQDLIGTMLERDILYESEARLTLGSEGERLYGGRNLLDLYSVFDTPPTFRVRHGRRDIGTLDVSFLRLMGGGMGGGKGGGGRGNAGGGDSDGTGSAGGGGSGDAGGGGSGDAGGGIARSRSGNAGGRKVPELFRLAGRPWAVRDIDWRRNVCYVEPAPRGQTPRWSGTGGYLSYEICQEMRNVLADDADCPWLLSSAAMEIESLRLGYGNVVPEGRSAIEIAPEGVTWHTFAGGAINALLAEALERCGGRWKRGNLAVSTDDKHAAAGAVTAIAGLASMDLAAVARDAATGLTAGNITKFQPCLPEAMEAELIVARVFDVAGAQRFVAERDTVVVQAV